MITGGPPSSLLDADSQRVQWLCIVLAAAFIHFLWILKCTLLSFRILSHCIKKKKIKALRDGKLFFFLFLLPLPGRRLLLGQGPLVVHTFHAVAGQLQAQGSRGGRGGGRWWRGVAGTGQQGTQGPLGCASFMLSLLSRNLLM